MSSALHEIITNAIKHGMSGLVSMRRGGGSFELTLTPHANTALDADNLVVGLVLDGMDVLERLNTLPTNNYDRAPLATVKIIGCKIL